MHADPGQISSATCLLAALRRATDFHLRGDYDAAERRLLAVLRLDPKLPQAHHHLAVVYHAQGRYRDALERLETAVAIDPTLPGSADRLEAYRFDAAAR